MRGVAFSGSVSTAEMKPTTLIATTTLAALVSLAPRSEARNQPFPRGQVHTEHEMSHRYPSAEWILVIVTGVTAGFICWQSWETKRAAKAAADSVEAINRQAGIMERQTALAERNLTLLIEKERPRVKITVDDFVLSSNDIQSVSFQILLSCPTRAFIVSAKADAYIMGALGFIPYRRITDLSEMVNQTTTIQVKHFVIFTFGAECVEKINAGLLHFQVSIEYRGDHVPSGEKLYQTTFHRRLRYEPSDFEGLSPYTWEQYGSPEENQET
jgi:hypothetical protein